jgi:hypothetical protein
MPTGPSLIRQADAERLLRAARRAGYKRARFVSYPDGRVEVTAESDGVEFGVQPIDEDHDAAINARLDKLGQD